MRHHEITAEASPSTLGRKFYSDLVSSKTWLAHYLKKELGNQCRRHLCAGLMVRQHRSVYSTGNIEFDRLIMVEPGKYCWPARRLLEPLYQEQRLPGTVDTLQPTYSIPANRHHSDQHQHQRNDTHLVATCA
jgi:hypothetical protein